MTQKFIRWNCPNCDTHNVMPAPEGGEGASLHCDYCQYIHDPHDDTWPKPEGFTEEGPDLDPGPASPRRKRPTPT